MSPTANSHFATKGYVDDVEESITSQLSPTLLYEDSFTITGSTSRENNSNINFGYKMLILEYDLSNATISGINNSSSVTFYFVDNGISTLQFYDYFRSSSDYKKKYTCMLYANSISTRNRSTNPVEIRYYEAGDTSSNDIYVNFDYVMTANSSNIFYCIVKDSAKISGSMIYRIYGLYAF